jgi:glycosyltransferase involved in cell wall biosynthesis
MITVLLPTMNEQDSIEDIIKRTKKSVKCEIIVIDKSADDTAKIAKRLGAKVIAQRSKGKGNAVMEGIKAAKYDDIIMLDCDSTYQPEDIPKFVKALKDHDFVNGNRFASMEEGSLKFMNMVANRTLTLFGNVMFSVKLNDWFSGMKAFKKSKLPELEAEGFDIEQEIIIKSSQNGLRISEIPITYKKRKGNTKMSIFSAGISIPVSMAKYAWRYKKLNLLILLLIFLAVAVALW